MDIAILRGPQRLHGFSVMDVEELPPKQHVTKPMKIKKLLQLTTALICTATGMLTSASAQTANNTLLRSRLALGADNESICAVGNTAYVARDSAGLAIIDTTNPAAPVLKSTILPFAHAHFSDVQVIGNIAYISNEVPQGTPTPHVGMFIYDVSNPLAPVELSRLEWGAGGGYHLGCDAHSVTVDVTTSGTFAYLTSGITGDVALFDVTDPALPVYLSQIIGPVLSYNCQAHDVVARNGRCYTTWLGGGFTVHDVSNPTAPVQLAYKPTSGINSEFFYHLALSDDSQTLITTGEITSSPDPVKLWNISNLASITLAGSFASPGGAIPHGIRVAGKYAYVAWLTDGLRILDISNPASPRSVAQYDPEAGSGSSFVGGTDVAISGNNVYLSHSSGGLYTLDFVDSITITRADWQRRNDRLVIEATSSAAPSTSLTVAGYGVMTYNVSLGRYTLTVNGVTSNPGSVTVTSDIGGTRTSTVRRAN